MQKQPGLCYLCMVSRSRAKLSGITGKKILRPCANRTLYKSACTAGLSETGFLTSHSIFSPGFIDCFCKQGRLKSACTDVQADLSLRCLCVL